MATTVDQKLLRQTKFPPEFNQKVDMQKVNVEVMKKWIAGRLCEILGSEDDIVTELCFNLLEGARFPDVKSLQIQLTGFLDKDTPKFCKDLWILCLSAQSNPQGVPKELLEAKKQELMQEKAEAEKAAQTASLQKKQQDNRDRNTESIRQRERAERGRGRGGWERREFDSRRPRISRSPPARRRVSPHQPPRRDMDTYVPGRGRRHPVRRGRSATRSKSRSSTASPAPPRYPRRNSSSMSRSRSNSRKRRRQYSRSRSPANKQGFGRGGKQIPSKVDHKKQTSFGATRSRSRSPRRARGVRSNSTSSSGSPPRQRHRKSTGQGYSLSPSPSSSADERGSGKYRKKKKHLASVSPEGERNDRHADIVRSRNNRDDRRLSRSPDDAQLRRSHRSLSRSRSRSRSSDRQRPNKRRRSLQRYEPAARRHRNTSSASPQESKRQRRTSSSSDRSSTPKEGKVGAHAAKQDTEHMQSD